MACVLNIGNEESDTPADTVGTTRNHGDSMTTAIQTRRSQYS
jgi:hypothetical protein